MSYGHIVFRFLDEAGQERRAACFLKGGQPIGWRSAAGNSGIHFTYVESLDDDEIAEKAKARLANGATVMDSENPVAFIRDCLVERGYTAIRLEIDEDASAGGSGASVRLKALAEVVAPCLYAVLLRPNDAEVALYVGSSGGHTPLCKFSLHTVETCICGASADPRRQASNWVRDHGAAVFDALQLEPTSVQERVAREKKWAQELADRLGVITWCDGKRYEPG